MPERVWFRSLYWRVALGFVAFLGAMLLVQAGLLFWLVARSSDTVAGRTPNDFATFVASDLTAAMTAGTASDPGAYLSEHYGDVSRSVVLVMSDGRVVSSHPGVELPAPLLDMARRRLRNGWRTGPGGGPGGGAGFGTGFGPGRWDGPPPMGADRELRNSPSAEPGTPPTGPGSAPGTPPAQAAPVGAPATGSSSSPPASGQSTTPADPRTQPFPGDQIPPGPPSMMPGGPFPLSPEMMRRQPLDRGGFRGMGVAPLLKDGTVIGVVVVPPSEPLPILLRQFAPTFAAIVISLLVVATAVSAWFVFRPAQQRLSAVEAAARQLGAGELAARVPVTGGDEVTAVARAFNAMADELDRRAQALETATDARRQLLADVSHELMTPLTAIRGYLETLDMPELQLDETTRRKYLGIVGAETGRLEHMIGDLLDLARLEAGGGAFTPGRVDVAALFARVTERHEREASEKGVRLLTDVAPAAAVAWGDGDRLEQVLQNLAANALRHTASGGEVRLNAEVQDEQTLLTVSDTGEGIPPEHLAHVFDRFYKADEARGANGRGSGLGLSIAKAIVERHGGTIVVSSEVGQGTRFEVRLPVVARPATNQPQAVS